MVSPIATTSPLSHITSASTPPPATSTAPSPEQSAALRQLEVRYSEDQSLDVAASTLSGLGKQIMALAQTLRQHVTLPQGAPGPGAASATAGKVNVTV
jgi:hypothetical protein